MSLSKYCLKDLRIYFHLMTDFLWVHPVKRTSAKYHLPDSYLPTIMNSAKQINFLPIFERTNSQLVTAKGTKDVNRKIEFNST